MKILIDECAPRALKRNLTAYGHDCLTVQEVGWSGKENGKLLALGRVAAPWHGVALAVPHPSRFFEWWVFRSLSGDA
jgi:hypothetical protein